MYTIDSPVRSAGVGTRDQWIAELTRRGADAPARIVDAYLKYAPMAGVNYDLGLAQFIDETTGGTDYKWTQYRNPAGLASTSRAATGDIFDSIEAGITAQMAHQCAYACTADECPIERMGDDMAALFNDSRHALVGHRGEPSIGYWNGHWAVPGTSYAQNIVAIANAVVGDATAPILPSAPPPVASAAPPMVDLRGVLHRNPAGGPNYQDNAKVGAVWHYNGPPPNADARTQYINDAVYHANLNWGSAASPAYGDGIMYHYGIGGDGTIYLLRDEADVLWHCGAWVPGGNETGIAININVGEGQRATAAQLASAEWLGNDLKARRGIAGAMFKGHQELSPTACPGTLMDDLVAPYRDGEIGGTVAPTPIDAFLHENGFVIGGGFKSIVDRLEAISHEFRMMFLGYAISNEGDGYLLIPETRDDGSTTGRARVKKVTIQKFERQTLIHEADEPNSAWQDVAPLVNRGFVAGFADDPAIDAVLKNPAAQVA